jgi:2-polyprenyl-3-methyl-5-hydroxy-6-metoxy-1,4-benzoquinol methylase
MVTTATIGELKHLTREFGERLAALKREHAPRAGVWYPYDSLSNFTHFEALLGPRFDLASLTPESRIADIGAADGDVAFFLESLGFNVTIIDHAATNANRLEGARLLKQLLASRTEICDIDLDAQFAMPVDVDLVLLLGILYHLKNPFYVLEALSRRTKFCLLSTRIARFTPDYKLDMRDYPVSYLVHASETNNDATNYWIFSEAGLQRLFERTGWRAEKFTTVGDRERSNPADSANDERAFCLLRST